MTAMVLGKKLLKHENNDEAIFVRLVERSDTVIVMEPRNGAQVSTVKRLSEGQRKDGDVIMALCGFLWRLKAK